MEPLSHNCKDLKAEYFLLSFHLKYLDESVQLAIHGASVRLLKGPFKYLDESFPPRFVSNS